MPNLPIPEANSRRFLWGAAAAGAIITTMGVCSQLLVEKTHDVIHPGTENTRKGDIPLPSGVNYEKLQQRLEGKDPSVLDSEIEPTP